MYFSGNTHTYRAKVAYRAKPPTGEKFAQQLVLGVLCRTSHSSQFTPGASLTCPSTASTTPKQEVHHVANS